MAAEIVDAVSAADQVAVGDRAARDLVEQPKLAAQLERAARWAHRYLMLEQHQPA